jgi:hypothetical protein
MKMEIEEAATMLGRELCGRVPHVVGTSVRVNKQREFELWVDVDAPEALRSKDIPTEWKSFKVHRRLGGTPEFA